MLPVLLLKLAKITKHPAETHYRLGRVNISRLLRLYGDDLGTGHKRIAISKDLVDEDKLLDAGYQPVSIAIPEAGQQRFLTYRHPLSLLHFHDHGPYVTVHEDKHPSVTMALQVAKTKPDKITATTHGLQHILTEGVPGGYYYLKNRLQDMVNQLANKQPSVGMLGSLKTNAPQAVFDLAYSKARHKIWRRLDLINKSKPILEAEQDNPEIISNNR